MANEIPHEDQHQRARRKGRESGAKGGDWRNNPHTPGTRDYFEFQAGQTETTNKPPEESNGNPTWA